MVGGGVRPPKRRRMLCLSTPPYIKDATQSQNRQLSTVASRTVPGKGQSGAYTIRVGSLRGQSR